MGRTALHYAAQQGDHIALADLLRSGADAGATDRSGWTALHFAAQSNALDVVRTLIESGAQVDQTDEPGNTALFRAVFAYGKSGEVIQTLLQAGANPNLTNAHGVSPASLARSIANTDVSKYF